MMRCSDCDLEYFVVYKDDQSGEPTSMCPRCGSDEVEGVKLSTSDTPEIEVRWIQSPGLLGK